jgi:hypothetical protein
VHGMTRGSAMNDLVECTNCDFRGVVAKGDGFCPKCSSAGTLAWLDGEPQEVNLPVTIVERPKD